MSLLAFSLEKKGGGCKAYEASFYFSNKFLVFVVKLFYFFLKLSNEMYMNLMFYFSKEFLVFVVKLFYIFLKLIHEMYIHVFSEILLCL